MANKNEILKLVPTSLKGKYNWSYGPTIMTHQSALSLLLSLVGFGAIDMFNSDVWVFISFSTIEEAEASIEKIKSIIGEELSMKAFTNSAGRHLVRITR